MRVYIDTSAALKRAVVEPESAALRKELLRHADAKDAFVSSTLTWIEVSRALWKRLDGAPHREIMAADENALSGIAEWQIGPEVVGLARRIGPHLLRSLDAIHLSTAISLNADVMITYDDRLAKAAETNGLTVSAPA